MPTGAAPVAPSPPSSKRSPHELHDRLKVVKLDVDQNPQTAMQYGVQSIPTLIIFKNGKEVERLIGYMSKAKLMSKIEPHL
jgi:thioredoxin 1